MKRSQSQPRPSYGRIRTPGELGKLARLHRRQSALTLQDVADTSTLGMRFLSEMERGKENVSLDRTLKALQTLGLDILILPRGEAERLLRERNRRQHAQPGTHE